MKRIITGIIVVAALLILVNASVWEGAASASVGDDFPETGYYVATNSFPRNTVVEITNLENNRSIRATVTAGLENPGLLVVLSKETADAIGLQTRSIGRVKMSQPADAVGSRFTEGLSGSGDPDYDPAAMISSAGIDLELLKDFSVDDSFIDALLAAASEKSSIDFIDESNFDTLAFVEDEEDIEDEDSFIEEDPIFNEPVVIAQAEAPAPVQENIAAVEPDPDPAPVFTPVEEPDPVPATPPVEVASAPVSPSNESPSEVYHSELENFDIVLVPADEKLPEGTQPGINPNDIVAPIASAPVEPVPVAEPAPVPAPAPVAQAPVEQPEPLAWPPDPAQTVATIPQTPAPASTSARFSAPLINDLEKGKYYIQLAALGMTDSVEAELTRIGSNYPLAIQTAGTSEKPIYRILVGPVNLGESGALLQRLRTTYKDAYVRQGS